MDSDNSTIFHYFSDDLGYRTLNVLDTCAM